MYLLFTVLGLCCCEGFSLVAVRGLLSSFDSQASPHSSVGKEPACNAGDLGSIPGSRRSPGTGNGNSLQYSCLENPMDRGAWRATVHGVARVGHDLVTKRPPMLQWVGSRAWASVVVAPGL